MRRSMERTSVVFPQPDSPTSPRVSPSYTWNDTSSTAFTLPTVFNARPLLMGNHLVRCLTSMITCLSVIPHPSLS